MRVNGYANTNYPVIDIVGIGGYPACPVGNANQIMVRVIGIVNCRVIRVDQSGQVTCGIILVADHLTIGIGIACHAVQFIVGSGDCTVAVGNGQHIAICVIGIAHCALGGGIAGNSAHCVIEELPYLSSCVRNLTADIQRVILVTLRTAGDGGLCGEPAHIVVGIGGGAAQGSCKSGHIAQQVMLCVACIIYQISDSNISAPGIIGKCGRMI